MASLPREIEDDEHETVLTFAGLAEDWESVSAIRVKARRVGALLEWPDAEHVGVVSMMLV